MKSVLIPYLFRIDNGSDMGNSSLKTKSRRKDSPAQGLLLRSELSQGKFGEAAYIFGQVGGGKAVDFLQVAVILPVALGG